MTVNRISGASSRFAAYGVLDRQLTNRESWITFWVLFAFCTITMYNSIRVMPILTDIGAVYGMTLDDSGLIVSMFGVAGLVFAYPGALIMHRFGIKSTLLVAAIISIIGTLLGLVTTDTGSFLFSRALEGVAFGIASVIVPNVVPRIFPAEKMGLVMGIWSLWVTPGNALAFLSTAPLFEAYGAKSGWVLALALELLCILLLIAFCKLPASVVAGNGSAASNENRDYKHVHFKSALAIGISMTCWGALYGAINTYFPTFLQVVHGQSIMLSSMVPLLLALITAPFSIIFGIIAGKRRNRKWFLFVGYVSAVALYLLIGFREDASIASVWIFAALFGIVAGAIPMTTYALIPILAEDPKKADYCTATLAFCLQLSTILVGMCGPLITMLGFGGFSTFIIAPMGVLGAVIAFFSIGDKQALAEQEEEASLAV